MEQEFISQLLKPSLYPEATNNVTLVQTHISFLFLTDDYVYKIKKPVDLGFLNFTTLDRRRFYCEEEVRLNRRLCPDVYLGVVKIRESGAGLSFQGDGKIIEYAVKMRRLPEGRMLHRLLREDRVGEDDVRRISAKIAEFHKNAERNADIDRYGDISVIRHNWDENFRQAAEFTEITLKRQDFKLIVEWVDRFLSLHGELFAERIEGGFIRDCDGDIHAENICLENGIYIFDCIEFNERFRYIDTAADIAFLLMDFDYHDKRSFSGIFLDEYRALSADDGLTRVLEFYKIYRAFVRGKVESFKLKDGSMSHEDKKLAEEKAVRHFRLARGYILREKFSPAIIIFSGLMGSGKSTLSSEIAFELGIDMVRSDTIRKKLAGIPVTERQFNEYGMGIYSDYYNSKTYECLLKTAGNAVASGRGIILDASFGKRGDRQQFRLLAQNMGVPFYIINTTCAEELIKQRLSCRILDEKEPSDGRWELYYRQKSDFEDIAEDEGNRIMIDTSRPLNENVDKIMRFLNLL